MSQTKEKKIESIIQYDSYEEQLYESINNVLYMLPGIYEMTATEVLAYKDGEEVGRYDIELDFVVTNMPLSVKAKLTKIKEYELISNQPLSLVLEPKEIAYIKIVPTKTATYTINSALILGLYYFDNSPSYVSGMLSIREYYSEGEVVRYKIENKECSSLSINNIILTQVAEEDIITD